jgi:hypothetical protein
MEPEMQLDQIAAEVRRLSDIDAVKQLKAKHVRLVDAKEWAMWGNEVLSEDCHLDMESGPIDGRDGIVLKISRSLAEARTVHRLHPPEIEITGPDSATAIWPMTDYVTGTFGGTPMIIRGYGHYHDEYVRTAEGWRTRSSALIRQRVDTSVGPSDSAGAE